MQNVDSSVRRMSTSAKADFKQEHMLQTEVGARTMILKTIILKTIILRTMILKTTVLKTMY